MTEEPQEPQIGGDGDDAVIGVAFKRSLMVIVAVAVVAALIYLVTRPRDVAEVIVERETIEAPEELDQELAERPDVRFVALEDAVDFAHFSGALGEKLLPECMGSGVALFDYDGDDDLDLFFTNGAYWPHNKAEGTHTQALFANDGKMNFTDVTAKAGLDKTFYAMGPAAGDVDGDGDLDLFISALGKNRLMLNNNGVFSDVTDAWGVGGDPGMWSSSAGFFDYDNDGDLDLFVCNYVAWTRDIDLELNFSLNGTDRAYGPPTSYAGTDSYLYRNDGGTFTDVSEAAGIHVDNFGNPMGKALAVTFADVDGDNNLDILVANDTVQNFVFQNNGDGTFAEMGILSGIAFDNMGAATGAMGMDAAFVGEDSRWAVGIANFANESTSLYVQQDADPWMFADMSNQEGIGSPSRLKLSFGLFFFDYDLDGRQDMLQANGHLEDEINEVQPSQKYRQPAQLFWNSGGEGGGRFAMAPEDQVGDLSKPIVGRGAGYGDLDGDGDLDVVLTQTGGKPLILRNDQDLGNNWVRFKLRGKPGNPEAVGARVDLTINGVTQRQTVMPTRSYLSHVTPWLTFGLGKASTIEKATITWPDGTTQELEPASLNGVVVIEQ